MRVIFSHIVPSEVDRVVWRRCFIAHGITGAVNDQICFDFVFEVLVLNVQIAPLVRGLELLRQQKIDYHMLLVFKRTIKILYQPRIMGHKYG